MASTRINETVNYIEKLQITQKDIIERSPLRNKLDLPKFKGFQENPRR